MRKLAFALALLAASPAAASPASLESDPAFMPTLHAFQQCMFSHIGSGDEDPYVRMQRSLDGACRSEMRDVIALSMRHHTAPETSSMVVRAYDAIGRRYVESYLSGLSLRYQKLTDNPHPCMKCGD